MKMYYFKVNIPKDEQSYASGNGEGVWVAVDERVKKAYDIDEDDEVYNGILDNNSIYYPKLKAGTTIPIEMRGEKRPVVPLEWLMNKCS